MYKTKITGSKGKKGAGKKITMGQSNNNLVQ